MNPNRICISIAVLCVLGFTACSGDGVNSEHQAEQAYDGLDRSIDKAIQLGFDGFNSASSANIAPQTANGDDGGTLTVAGQVDQGASANKGMRLQETLTAYSDDGSIQYDTLADAGLPELDMQLKNIPTGTLDGTLAGTYQMSGALEGSVTLAVTFSGALQAGDGGAVERKAGSTHITGTATSGDDTFNIDLTR